MKHWHSTFQLYRLLSLHYIHKLIHCTVTEVLLLSRKYLNISLGNEIDTGETYFVSWC